MSDRPSRLLVLSLVLCAGLATIIGISTNFDDKTTSRYIVQAAHVDTARHLSQGVGGTVTHELGIIDAVAAQLTGHQKRRLLAAGGVRRIYADREVRTASGDTGCSVTAESMLDFGGDKIKWEIRNTGESEVQLDSAMVLWPATNNYIKEIKFAGKKTYTDWIYDTAVTLDADDWETEGAERRLESGKKKKIEIKFDEAVEDQHAYEIRLFFREGCSIDFPPPVDSMSAGDSDKKAKRNYVSSLVGADALHAEGITGDGVGVAIIDSGIWAKSGAGEFLEHGFLAQDRILAQYDAIEGELIDHDTNSDESGHGSHVASIIASSRYKHFEFNGIAPDASLVAIRAFGEDGSGTYADVIRALDWAITNRDTYGIRILNLSFSAVPRSYYWDDPLNQAVMRAWQYGLVVVASAGNRGPEPMTIGVPGNVPYVITVGAMTDGVTPKDPGDDALASFSSAGPTFEAFVKPDVVAPGGHVRGLMKEDSRIGKRHPHFHDGESYFTMSGTSQSAAVTSGIAALLLEAEPWLTPDQVKCKLLESARPAVTDDGDAAYSVFQQGTGLVNAAVAAGVSDGSCANRGIDVNADLAGSMHFRGLADRDADGNYYIIGSSGFEWDGTFSYGAGFAWNSGMVWNDGKAWNDGMVWNSGMVWNDGIVWNDGMVWNDLFVVPVSINTWVEQE